MYLLIIFCSKIKQTEVVFTRCHKNLLDILKLVISILLVMVYFSQVERGAAEVAVLRAEHQGAVASVRRGAGAAQPPALGAREAAVERGLGARAAVSGSGHQRRDPGVGRRATTAAHLARVNLSAVGSRLVEF